MRRAVLCVLPAALACSIACSGGSDSPGPEVKPPPTPAPPVPGMPGDAGILGITQIRPYDPASGMHLDDDVGSATVPAAPAVNRPGRPIDVTLRSTPPNAQAAVDGVIIGTTPTYWAGQANGREHEFTFVLRGYAIARYRFVPITSGVVHAKLERIVEDTGSGSAAGAVPMPQHIQTQPAQPPVVAPPPAPIAPDAQPAGSAAPGSAAEGSASLTHPNQLTP